MATQRLVQGRLGKCTFTPAAGSPAVIPVYDWAMQSRRNRVTGDPVGNTWSTNYADGMQTSRFTARILCRKKTDEAFAAAFLTHFITRAVVEGLDDTTAFTIDASDGAAIHTLTECKPESFTLTIAKGSPIGLSVVFVSPNAPTVADGRASSLVTAYDQTIDEGVVMMFNAATFKTASTPAGLAAGATLAELYNAEITYSNNHIVNAPLDGTLGAASFDAGVIRCGATFTVKAHHGLTGDLAPFTTESAMRITLSLGSTNTAIFDLSKLVPETDLDAGANVGASYRTWQCLALGYGEASPIAPLVLSFT